MVGTGMQKMSLYVERSSQKWIVRDGEGRYWIVPYGNDAWNRREPFNPTEETNLEPVPGHYRYMLNLPS